MKTDNSALLLAVLSNESSSEARRGAADAIAAILTARKAASGNSNSAQNLDPALTPPSAKNARGSQDNQSQDNPSQDNQSQDNQSQDDISQDDTSQDDTAQNSEARGSEGDNSSNSHQNINQQSAGTENSAEDMDPEIGNIYKDATKEEKARSRKIKIERTIKAGKHTLEKSKETPENNPKIKKLTEAVTELEKLAELSTSDLAELPGEQLEESIDRVFTAIEAVDSNSGITFTSAAEHELQVAQVNKELASAKIKNDLSTEDTQKIRADMQAIQAKDKESDKYRPKSPTAFKGFQEFLVSLYRAIALQVQTEEAATDSWGAINRRYSSSSILKPGKRLTDLPNKRIPIIDFYFDCSGSWGTQDIAKGKEALASLAQMEADGKIKINVYYFANTVSQDFATVKNEGGTYAWKHIVRNVIATGATNVVIMTDFDMEDLGDHDLKYTVPGYVWYLWRDGYNAPRLPHELAGRGGTMQFSFTTS